MSSPYATISVGFLILLLPSKPVQAQVVHPDTVQGWIDDMVDAAEAAYAVHNLECWDAFWAAAEGLASADNY